MTLALATPATPTPGVYFDISEEAYNDDCAGISARASSIKTLLDQTPMHAAFEHPRLNPEYQRAEEKKFDLGTAAHAMVLGSKITYEVFDLPSWQNAKKEDKAAKAEAYARGAVPILESQYARLERMALACHEQLASLADGDGKPLPHPLKDGGRPEVTLVWDDPVTGVRCRCRLDWLPGAFAAAAGEDGKMKAPVAVYDFKSTSGSANPLMAYRHLLAIGSDIQAAMYSRGVKACLGVQPVFRFIMQEIDPPFALSVVEPGPAFMQLAEDRLTQGLLLWRRCVRENRWPAYPARVATIEPPVWAIAQEQERAQLAAIDRDRGIDSFAMLRTMKAWQAPAA